MFREFRREVAAFGCLFHGDEQGNRSHEVKRVFESKGKIKKKGMKERKKKKRPQVLESPAAASRHRFIERRKPSRVFHVLTV